MRVRPGETSDWNLVNVESQEIAAAGAPPPLFYSFRLILFLVRGNPPHFV